MSRVQALDPLRFPLHGQRLIEASAGTGKTYTIALLYLRLVLGHGEAGTAFARALTPPEILVVTFTEAATQELRERIRARLDEAARVFAGEAEAAPGDVLAALRADFAPDRWPACAHRLRVAAQWMDEAAVATIHGWAWRMLREHAFDSGSLFRQTLQTDLAELQQRVLQDHWRRHYYPLAAPAAQMLLQCFAHPEALWKAVEPLLRREDALLQLQGNALAGDDDALAALHAAGAARQRADALEQAARAAWAAARADLERLWHAARPHLSGTSYRNKDDDAVFAGWLQALADWSAGAPAPKNIALFGLAGARLKKNQAPPAHPALQAIDAWLEAGEGIDIDALRARLAAQAAQALREGLAAEKLRRAELGFDDLLQQLDRALHGEGGAALAARIRAQFPLALIDEFQDTDPVQYRIFRRIYAVDGGERADRDRGLVMIGDPKQAIYGFRGADIRTYLRARRDVGDALYALDTNHRSTGAVVRAVNHVFLHAEAQPRAAFRFALDTGNPVPFVPVQARGRAEWLQIDGQPANALTLWSLEPPAGADKPRVGSAEYRSRMAEASASAVVHWLRGADAGRTGFVHGDSLQPLRPADIAVLVRSGSEADAVRTALNARGLRSVYLSDRASVFATPEAQDLLHWLRACAAPADEALLRSALATRLLCVPLAELARLREDELAWEALALRFRALRELWQRHGVLPMLHQLLHDFDLPARWLAEPGGERRLTNVLHLAEWLQRRAVELDGEHALLRALAERLAHPEGEEDILRLESDAALIKVVTIHKSKGLEYPLVVLPFISAWREVRSGKQETLGFHDDAADQRVLELDGQHTQARALAEEERLAEDLRLLYVALTRARHGLWLGLAPLAPGNAGKPQLHRSALGHVLAGGEPIDDLAGYRARLAALAAGCDDIALVPAPEPDDATWQAAPPPPVGPARQPQRAGHAPWWIASYSALVQQLGAAAAEPEDARQDQALEEAELADPADAPESPRAPAAGSWHAFPRGAEPGSFLHGLLEWCALQGFAHVVAQPQALRDLVARRCAVRGWEAWIDPLCDWVPRWLQLPLALPGHASPVALDGLAQYQTELEFWFPIHRADTRAIDALVTAHTFDAAPRPALANTRLAGMLKGFMDLVFEHEGRYWVADYKSNWLGADARAYDAAAMQQALLAHRYDVQYLLYVFALHRLLGARLPDYDYDRHVGGALYLFLRGAEADTRGVFATKPPRALIEALDTLFRHDAA
ncbi:exodeoxyribonuclease V subunit beta [Pseudorhodoferax sp. Leaf274]|uniref:exodeoxyribonuclease V subunit beta n=1 Tax=Pseudorhodoferax sp. Leaf274 TaxID=1736318 RepID=UPI00070271E0|nr:exodeoxyribonuclease V subunit beta [Pseudorhodoferax sp. Leaf274]KQP49595.1 exodeoxyribonuclease V subunit beta [Pseudorhodoferax sp. Leaf274]